MDNTVFTGGTVQVVRVRDAMRQETGRRKHHVQLWRTDLGLPNPNHIRVLPHRFWHTSTCPNDLYRLATRACLYILRLLISCLI
jgi:hypothetical protein